jgi:hypothetical protein
MRCGSDISRGGRSSADFARSLRDIPVIADLLAMLIEEQVIITKALLPHVSIKSFLLKQSLLYRHPAKQCEYQTIDGFLRH